MDWEFSSPLIVYLNFVSSLFNQGRNQRSLFVSHSVQLLQRHTVAVCKNCDERERAANRQALNSPDDRRPESSSFWRPEGTVASLYRNFVDVAYPCRELSTTPPRSVQGSSSSGKVEGRSKESFALKRPAIQKYLHAVKGSLNHLR